MSTKPKLICITGPDGAGKTTQITKLAEHFVKGNASKAAANKVVAVTIWDMLLDLDLRSVIPFKSGKEVDAYLAELDNTPRSLFLFHCLRQALDQAEKKNPDIILLNAYWYKYVATEISHGSDREMLFSLAEQIFPEPDMTFYLSITPELAFERKTAGMLSGYETGFVKTRTKSAFVDFQTQAHIELEQLAKDKSWIRVEHELGITEARDRILDEVKKFS